MTVLARNRRVFHDYQVHEQLEAGLVLQGWEVKGILAGQAQLTNCHVNFKEGEAWMQGCHINPPSNVEASTVDPLRPRKLLLKEAELRKFDGKVKLSGLTVVVIDLHRSHGKIKAAIALAKGKKKHDKRHAAKEKDLRRRMEY